MKKLPRVLNVLIVIGFIAIVSDIEYALYNSMTRSGAAHIHTE